MEITKQKQKDVSIVDFLWGVVKLLMPAKKEGVPPMSRDPESFSPEFKKKVELRHKMDLLNSVLEKGFDKAAAMPMPATDREYIAQFVNYSNNELIYKMREISREVTSLMKANH